MKRLIALVLALVCAASMALAEGRTPPEDKKVITTTDLGVETVFKKYDGKFYDKPSEQPGQVVRLDYETTAYGQPLKSWVNVYVPYGYDPQQQYNIIYFLHGTNETQDSFIGDERAKNALDNMIETGVAEPFLMVFPTYYYDYENRAIDIPAFMVELREAIMPAVEGQYATYAPTADTEGFQTSREHRAFAGYSRGAYATWHAMFNLLDTAKWWMPFSAGVSGEAEMEVPGPAFDQQVRMITDGLAAQPAYRDDFFIYVGCGGPRDMMYDIVQGLVKAMVDSGAFSYGLDPQENNLFYSLSAEVHQTLMSRYYLYNAFDVIFK